MSKKKILFGFGLGSISLTVDSLLGLITYPLILRYLNKELAGLWFLFMSIGGFVSLAQFGLGPVIIRKTAFEKIKGDGNRFFPLVNCVRKIYWVVFCVSLLFCVAIYVIYLGKVVKENGYRMEGLILWSCASLGFAFRLLASRNFYLINGLGELGWDKVVQIISNVSQFILYWLLLGSGFGVISLGIMFCSFGIIQTVLSKFVLGHFSKKIHNNMSQLYSRDDYFQIIKDAMQLFVLTVSGYVVMNSGIFIVERLFGVGCVSQYSALMKISSLIISVSTMIQQMTFPYVSQAWGERDIGRCRYLYLRGIFGSVGIGLFMSAIVFLAGPVLIPLWLGKGNYLGNSFFGILLIFSLIYIHHNAHANPVIATGSNAFIGPAIINAVLTLPLSIIGGLYLGISGVVLGMLIATLFPSIYVVYFSISFFYKS